MDKMNMEDGGYAEKNDMGFMRCFVPGAGGLRFQGK
jgi:hypothetical protein